MGEENSTPKSERENTKKRVDRGSAQFGAAGASAAGEATLNTVGSGVAAATAGNTMTIGPYALLRILGEGGMGQVWLAEQTSPVKRQVALKLIKGGLYDSSVIQRFESERQSLAVMNHPAIAKVFDPGSTKDGQPYFVMEYVDGPPITRYCDNKRLKIRERLELFIRVCEGVQHAHQKAIIHRDLKPSNILVTEVDGKPVPRIIDFGIAKAISSQSGPEQTQFTEMGALIGTRGFISPEQADPGVLDVDTRTDVYSLGALLYVLLTGMLPFDSDGGKKKPIDEVLRQLREEDPPSPSTKVSTEKDTATVAAERRGAEPKQLAKLLRGDLDWIAMKAVEKDRARRYGTPSELSLDIERYLENRPVVARPASAGYRLKKYVQRHRLGVVAATGAVALLVAFAITEAVQLRRTMRERDRANRITDFMTNMFEVSDPGEARGNVVTAREILDKASKDIGAGLAKDPELQAQMMVVMGTVYDNLGLYTQSESLTAHAVEIRRRVLGPRHPDTLQAEEELGWELFREGRYTDAERLLRPLIDESRRVLGPTNSTTVLGMEALGKTLTDERRYQEAEKLDRESLDIEMHTLGPEHPATAHVIENLADLLTDEGQFAESEKLHRQALDMHRRIQGPEHPSTLISMHNLAVVLSDEGRNGEAETLYREELDIARRVLGLGHPDTAHAMNDLANVLSDEGRYEEAERLNREALEIRRQVFGPDHPITASSVYNLACLAALTGRRDEAMSLLSQAVDHGLSSHIDLGISKDTDLKSLHGDPRFAAIVQHAEQRAAAAQKPN
jgi:serine/threonine protein kinase/tetratricopeptide (TPR) repeat protein